jgi:hypothetical protein
MAWEFSRLKYERNHVRAVAVIAFAVGVFWCLIIFH